ncbi:NAD-dependent epimerase/dehydratase family protein, partial [Myxococcota bacterium]|nr:NAD-dependent epimerase/dehydratase family protein [Myxococcota bacterium]
HVSSPSVIFAHRDVAEADEDTPYPRVPANEYARSKQIAEALVLARRPSAAIIRPRAVFGPGDTALFPRLLRVLALGRLRIIGDGQNVVDLTYIDNVIDALLSAGARPEAAGIFHITNGAPTALWALIAQLAARLDLPIPTRRVPYRLAYTVAGILEALHGAFAPDKEPALTRYSASVLARSVTLSIARARQQLDYAPRVSIEEGVERFFTWWQAEGSP